jgi:hypothetical protein
MAGQATGEAPSAASSRLDRHAARDFDALGVDPAIVLGQQRRDHRADVVGQAGAAERRHVGDALVQFRIVAKIFIFHIGGAATRVPVSSTAFPQRNAHFGMNVHSRWRDQSADQQHIEWARRAFEATAPFASGTAYVNFMPGDEGERVQSAYGENYARLI